MHSLKRFLGGREPRDVAIELLNAGFTIDDIVEKLGVTRGTVLVYTRGARKTHTCERRWFAPDGAPLGEWMRANRVRSIPYLVVVGRLRRGWTFWDAVYKAYRPYRPRKQKIESSQADMLEGCMQ